MNKKSVSSEQRYGHFGGHPHHNCIVGEAKLEIIAAQVHILPINLTGAHLTHLTDIPPAHCEHIHLAQSVTGGRPNYGHHMLEHLQDQIF